MTAVIRILAAVGYPVLIYAGLTILPPRWLAVGVGALLVAHVCRRAHRADLASLTRLALPAACVVALLVLAAAFNEGRFFLFAPALFNSACLVAFARTLRRGPSAIETLARLTYGELALGGESYCRRVTIVWCVFFGLNAAVSLWLALYASLGVWTMYNGVIAYVLVGVLLAVEFVYRSWRFRHYTDTPVDAVMRRIFPPVA